MDYTPVTFTNHTYAHRTTYGHELALSVMLTVAIRARGRFVAKLTP